MRRASDLASARVLPAALTCLAQAQGLDWVLEVGGAEARNVRRMTEAQRRAEAPVPSVQALWRSGFRVWRAAAAPALPPSLRRPNPPRMLAPEAVVASWWRVETWPAANQRAEQHSGWEASQQRPSGRFRRAPSFDCASEPFSSVMPPHDATNVASRRRWPPGDLHPSVRPI